MNKPLRILIVEDSDDDTELIQLTLRRGGYRPTSERVETAAAMQAALERESWDLVIADYTLPHFSGIEALELLRQSGLDLPFIIVSGTINEEMAVAAIKAGAHDYVLKSNLSRIVPAVEREMRESLNRAERRRVEQQVQIQQILLDQVQAAVVAIDLSRRVIYWNRYSEKLYGWTREEALGSDIFDLFVLLDQRDKATSVLEQVRAGQLYESDAHARRRDGSVIPVRVSNSPLRDGQGNVIGYIGISADITERKRGEEERERLLAREQAARAEAEAASRAKDEFLATVSHELRTPLNAMLGWIYLMRTGRLDPATTERAVETIERNTRLQAQLIEDLLDVSRIIAGKLKLNVRPTDISSLIVAAIESLRLAAESKGIECRFFPDPNVGVATCDPGRIQQVIWNLLSNAIKFTPQGGRVTIQLTRRNQQAVITVSDTGQGVSPDFLPYVFERFRQADSTATRVHGGIGLGLSIVRHLVELHGGTVAAESDGPDKGATFTVTLPLVQVRNAECGMRNDEIEASAGESAICNLQSAILDGLRVLVVDDDFDVRELLTTLLGKCHVNVMAVASASEALRAIREQKPDVLVSDIAMPGEDGYALIGQLRQLSPESGGHIPAVALTAYARSEDRTKVLAAGFQAHLSKPVEPTELTEVVANLARAARSS
ncbi:MAG TPA: response regulator [Blastocatellia bacterium]|nr:response regulator [Blastocatellia bacterium]